MWKRVVELKAFTINHSLSGRDLTTLVRDEDIINTEHMTTLAVVVPKAAQQEWMLTYEKLCDYVVNTSAAQTCYQSVPVAISPSCEADPKSLRVIWIKISISQCRVPFHIRTITAFKMFAATERSLKPLRFVFLCLLRFPCILMTTCLVFPK